MTSAFPHRWRPLMAATYQKDTALESITEHSKVALSLTHLGQGIGGLLLAVRFFSSFPFCTVLQTALLY